MTAKRRDNHSTEFGLWLRNEQPIKKYCQHCGNTWIEGGDPIRENDPISSNNGYVTTNIDYLWRNYISELWMILEEKRYNTPIRRWQRQLFDLVDQYAKNDPNYLGFHIVKFERTSPNDGNTLLDDEIVTVNELVKFLKMDEG